MRGLILVNLFACLCCFTCVGQDGLDKFAVLQLKPAIGFVFPLTDIAKNVITDDLIGHESDLHLYVQVISASYFINRKWGIDFNFQLFSSFENKDRDDLFNLNIQTKYGSTYFVDTRVGSPNFEGRYIRENGDVSFALGIGPRYRFERNNFYISPAFHLGFVELPVTSGFTRLKESNTHNKLLVSYSPKDEYSRSLSFTTGLTLGYRLNRYLLLNFDISYSGYKLDLEYEERILDVITQNKSTQTISYNNVVHNVYFGLGLIAEISFSRGRILY